MFFSGDSILWWYDAPPPAARLRAHSRRGRPAQVPHRAPAGAEARGRAAPRRRRPPRRQAQAHRRVGGGARGLEAGRRADGSGGTARGAFFLIRGRVLRDTTSRRASHRCVAPTGARQDSRVGLKYVRKGIPSAERSTTEGIKQGMHTASREE